MSLADSVKKLEAELAAAKGAVAIVEAVRAALGPTQLSMEVGGTLVLSGVYSQGSPAEDKARAEVDRLNAVLDRVMAERAAFLADCGVMASALKEIAGFDGAASAIADGAHESILKLRAERDDWKARALEAGTPENHMCPKCAVAAAYSQGKGHGVDEERADVFPREQAILDHVTPVLERLVAAGRMDEPVIDDLDTAVAGLLEDLECANADARATREDRDDPARTKKKRKTSKASPQTSTSTATPAVETEEAGGGVPPAPSPAPEVPLIEAVEDALPPCTCSHAADHHDASGECIDEECPCFIYEAEEARSEPPPSPAFPRDGFVVTRTNAKPAPAHRVFLDGTKGWTTYRENADVFPSREAAMVAKKRGATVMHTGELSTIIVPTERSSADDEEVETITEIPADGETALRQAMGCKLRARDVHEVLARSAGGSILDEDNCITVCPVAHSWIGDHPREALAIGLRASRYAGRNA